MYTFCVTLVIIGSVIFCVQIVPVLSWEKSGAICRNRIVDGVFTNDHYHYDSGTHEYQCCATEICDEGTEPVICSPENELSTSCKICDDGFYNDLRRVKSFEMRMCKHKRYCSHGMVIAVEGDNRVDRKCACNLELGYVVDSHDLNDEPMSCRRVWCEANFGVNAEGDCVACSNLTRKPEAGYGICLPSSQTNISMSDNHKVPMDSGEILFNEDRIDSLHKEGDETRNENEPQKIDDMINNVAHQIITSGDSNKSVSHDDDKPKELSTVKPASNPNNPTKPLAMERSHNMWIFLAVFVVVAILLLVCVFKTGNSFTCICGGINYIGGNVTNAHNGRATVLHTTRRSSSQVSIWVEDEQGNHDAKLTQEMRNNCPLKS